MRQNLLTAMPLSCQPPHTDAPPRQAMRAWWSGVAVILLAGLLWASTAGAADDFLEPEKAFVVTARVVEAGKAEVLIRIAPGYYLYRERFAFSAQGATLGQPDIPPGQVKFDQTFAKEVETYRGELRIGLPLLNVQVTPFPLTVVSQGCADAGLCYPPMTTQLRLDAAAAVSMTAVSATAPATATATASGLAGDLVDGAAVGAALAGGHFWPVVGAFFAVGLLLSLTPCVLPMLPILSSIIVGTQAVPSRLRGLALAGCYSLGMALVYTALGVLAGLAGEGFGAALQTPWALVGFALLLALFSLSMFDVYDLRLPARWTTSLAGRCNKLPAGQLVGVFAMGGASALILSPCVTAPLASALLFIGQTGDVVLGGAALFVMAAGMSVPLLLLGASAGRWLPRSGPWMHLVKRAFGVLMLGVAVWVAHPVLATTVQMALWGLLLLLLGFMLRPFATRMPHRHLLRTGAQRTLGLGALAVGVMQLVGAASGGRDPLQPLAHLVHTPGLRQAQGPHFQAVHNLAELDAQLRTATRPVVLDFYADWCVSCKEMERFTFSDRSVSERLGNAILLKADVSANNADDRALLRRFKLFGPPGTLFFDRYGRELVVARVVGFQNTSRFAHTLSAAGL